ncbi:MAG TPA: hypothetical protein VIG06_02085 [Kofleriaceae bacterium]
MLALFAASPALGQPGAPQPQPQPQPAPAPPQPQPQPAPAPYPYPPPPAPYPYPYPYPYPPPPNPYAPPAPPQVATAAPPAEKKDGDLSPVEWASAVFFFHGLCPDGANPMCSGGIWLGLRGLTISGPPEEPIGLAVDLKAGFGFGFGFEVKDPDPMVMNDRESAAHVLTGAEVGVGPGVRLGVADLVPILGVGADALAYGFTGSDDEATSEAFWYGAGALRLHLGDTELSGTAARQYRDRWDRYADRIEVGFSWKAGDKGRVGLTVWWLDYDRFTVAGGGIVAAPFDSQVSNK